MLQAARLIAKTGTIVSNTMRSLSLDGIFPPITTCFNKIGDVDAGKLAENLTKLNKTGISGYVVFGSNGEFPLLDADEKILILKTARKAANADRKTVIAGVGGESLKQTLKNAVAAKANGADAALVTTPWFYKSLMTANVLLKYFQEVADNSPLPVILYNVPSNTGVELEGETIVQLARHKNIVGVKDSGGNISKIASIIGQTKSEDFQVLAGSAGFLLPSLMLGAVGGVLGVANVLPAECVQLYRLFKDGKMDQAKELQYRLVKPNDLVTRKYGIPGVKAMMEKFGYYGGPVRSPLQPLESELIGLFLKIYEENGFKPPGN